MIWPGAEKVMFNAVAMDIAVVLATLSPIQAQTAGRPAKAPDVPIINSM